MTAPSQPSPGQRIGEMGPSPWVARLSAAGTLATVGLMPADARAAVMRITGSPVSLSLNSVETESRWDIDGQGAADFRLKRNGRGSMYFQSDDLSGQGVAGYRGGLGKVPILSRQYTNEIIGAGRFFAPANEPVFNIFGPISTEPGPFQNHHGVDNHATDMENGTGWPAGLKCAKLISILKKAFPVLCLVAGGLTAIALDASQAKAFVVNISGTDYNVTTFVGNPAANTAKFNTPGNGGTMPWWGNEALAIEFATAVETALGSPNGPDIPINGGTFSPGNTVTGPFFATLAGEPVYAAFYSFTAVQVQSFIDFDYNVNYTYAEVLPSPPTPVPGPLPIFGAAAAFGMSRRLRRRIRLNSRSNQG